MRFAFNPTMLATAMVVPQVHASPRSFAEMDPDGDVFASANNRNLQQFLPNIFCGNRHGDSGSGGVSCPSGPSIPTGAIVVDGSGDDGAFATIQEAINSASEGDTVVVMPSKSSKGWVDLIEVNVSGITLMGSTNPAGTDLECCPDVILDGCEFNDCKGFVNLVVTASNVTVKNFLMRHSQLLISENATDTVVSGNCIRGTVQDSIVSDAQRTTIDGNYILGSSGFAVDLNSDFAVVKNNYVPFCDDGFRSAGDYILYEDNFITFCNDVCIRVEGQHTIVRNNHLETVDDGVLAFDCTNLSITGNIIDGSSNDAVTVKDASYAYVANNEVFDTFDDDHTIVVETVEFIVIENNFLMGASDSLVKSENCGTVIVRGNTVSNSGVEGEANSLMRIEGYKTAIVEDNVMSSGGYDCIRISTTFDESFINLFVRGNVISNCGRSGIWLGENNGGLIEDNVISIMNGEGIAMLSACSNMTLSGNVIEDCRIDLCNEGTDNVFGDDTNQFTTGGLNTNCTVAS